MINDALFRPNQAVIDALNLDRSASSAAGWADALGRIIAAALR